MSRNNNDNTIAIEHVEEGGFNRNREALPAPFGYEVSDAGRKNEDEESLDPGRGGSLQQLCSSVCVFGGVFFSFTRIWLLIFGAGGSVLLSIEARLRFPSNQYFEDCCRRLVI